MEKVGKIDVPRRAQYLRVLAAELQRIASHCLWLGTWCMDMGGALGGGATVFLYCIRERELILDLFEALTGARLLYGFHQVGGVRYDLPAGWAEQCRQTLDLIEQRLREYEAMLEDNPFFLVRTQGVGVISRELAQDVGVSGPLIRGSGIDYDVRRAEPYSSYEDFDFKVPVETAGDCYARYRVRMVEFRESIAHRRARRSTGCPRARSRRGPGVKSVGQVRVPKGEGYTRVEGARGEIGCYLVADGGAKPYRLKWRGASFSQPGGAAPHHPRPQDRRRRRDHGLRRPRLRRGRPMTEDGPRAARTCLALSAHAGTASSRPHGALYNGAANFLAQATHASSRPHGALYNSAAAPLPRDHRVHRPERGDRPRHLRHAARAQVRRPHAVAHRPVLRRLAARLAAADRRRAQADDEGGHRPRPPADRWVYNLAPIVFLVPCMLIFATIPFAPGLGVADLNIGVLFFLAVSSLEIVGLFMGGWGSNNKYALLSAMRAVNQIISYDLPFIFAALIPVVLAGSLQMSAIVAAQAGLFGWFVFYPVLGQLAFVALPGRHAGRREPRAVRHPGGGVRAGGRLPRRVQRDEVRAHPARPSTRT